MRKGTILVLGLLIASFCNLMAGQSSDQRTIYMKHHTNGQPESTMVLRAPQRIPVEVYYCETTHSIVVIPTTTLQGSVTLSHNGTIIASSDDIGTSFELPYASGEYEIVIETESWTAIGTLSL